MSSRARDRRGVISGPWCRLSVVLALLLALVLTLPLLVPSHDLEHAKHRVESPWVHGGIMA